jgi:hypothetical protein
MVHNRDAASGMAIAMALHWAAFRCRELYPALTNI